MSQVSHAQRVAASARSIVDQLHCAKLPRTLVVLGSGFKGLEQRLQKAKTVNLGSVPHVPEPRIEGHGAALAVGALGGVDVAILTGRVHLYEGYTASEVVYALRVLATLGVERVLLTNAAGSVDPNIKPGQVILVRDQINLTGQSCLIGADAVGLGPLFLDMGIPFDPEWRAGIAQLGGVTPGVYAGVLGPSYETPAETRMLGSLGAHVVGMSTVQEVLAARHLGQRVACLSFVTNMAGGLGAPLTHAEVLALAKKHRESLHDLVAKAVGALP